MALTPNSPLLPTSSLPLHANTGQLFKVCISSFCSLPPSSLVALSYLFFLVFLSCLLLLPFSPIPPFSFSPSPSPSPPLLLPLLPLAPSPLLSPSPLSLPFLSLPSPPSLSLPTPSLSSSLPLSPLLPLPHSPIGNGNLVVYRGYYPSMTPLWSSGTTGVGTGPYTLVRIKRREGEEGREGGRRGGRREEGREVKRREGRV